MVRVEGVCNGVCVMSRGPYQAKCGRKQPRGDGLNAAGIARAAAESLKRRGLTRTKAQQRRLLDMHDQDFCGIHCRDVEAL